MTRGACALETGSAGLERDKPAWRRDLGGIWSKFPILHAGELGHGYGNRETDRNGKAARAGSQSGQADAFDLREYDERGPLRLGGKGTPAGYWNVLWEMDSMEETPSALPW